VSESQPPCPALSVVVAVTSGGEQVDRCLEALERQRDAPAFEVIVPVDPALREVARWRRRFPSVEFLELRPAGDGSGPGHRHLEYDRRRAAGLAAARAPIVALTEDHARPAVDWCSTIARSHAALPHAAIGGAIDDASRDRLSFAVWLCDFGRYQSPLPAGAVDAVSDVNVSYKANALEAIAAIWTGAYHETAVHGALRARGETLWLDPSIRVEQQRGPLRLADSLRERFAWGRLYAGKRTREISASHRRLLALGSPLLPTVLLARLVRTSWQRRRVRGRLLAALPLVVLLLCAWSAGEAAGYWSGRPVARS